MSKDLDPRSRKGMRCGTFGNAMSMPLRHNEHPEHPEHPVPQSEMPLRETDVFEQQIYAFFFRNMLLLAPRVTLISGM